MRKRERDMSISPSAAVTGKVGRWTEKSPISVTVARNSLVNSRRRQKPWQLRNRLIYDAREREIVTISTSRNYGGSGGAMIFVEWERERFRQRLSLIRKDSDGGGGEVGAPMGQIMDLRRCNIDREQTTTKKGKYMSTHRQPCQCTTFRETISIGCILGLPIHLLYGILSRLPIDTIFSCRCVCKTFLTILTDPYFAELHLTKATNVDHSLIIQNNYFPSDFSLAYISHLEKLSTFPSWNIDYHSNYRHWRNLTIPNIVSQSEGRVIASLVGSCNGLLCLSYYTMGITYFYVCNPILGEFISLPRHSTFANQVAAFGFAPKTKQYKVIRFVTTTYCEVHTLGTDYWRKIENAPYPDHPVSMDSSLNGNLHWITTSSNISNMICSLNLETEQFRHISPPSHFNQDIMMRISCIRAGAIGGLFCVFYLFDEDQLEVFVMKEYGVEASWTKEFTISLMFDFLWESIPIIPMKLLNNGDLLVRYNYSTLVYYSSRKKIFRELMAPGYYDVVDHASSFISLKDIAGDKNIQVVSRNEFALGKEKRPIGINLSTVAVSETLYVGNDIFQTNEGYDDEWPEWTLGHQWHMATLYTLAQHIYYPDVDALDHHISKQTARPVEQISHHRSFWEAGLEGMFIAFALLEAQGEAPNQV